MTIALIVLVYLAQFISTVMVTSKFFRKANEILDDRSDDKRHGRFWLASVKWIVMFFGIYFVTAFINHSIVT